MLKDFRRKQGYSKIYWLSGKKTVFGGIIFKFSRHVLRGNVTEFIGLWVGVAIPGRELARLATK